MLKLTRLLHKPRCTEKIFEFAKILSKAFQKHAPLRKVFVRNEKPLYSLAKKFVSTTTREEEINRDKLSTECEFIKFGKTKTPKVQSFTMSIAPSKSNSFKNPNLST